MDQEHYTLATEVKGKVLCVRASGVRTLATAKAMTMEIFDAALANRLSRVLIDVKRLKGRLGILNSYLLVTETFEMLRQKGLRKAAILDKPVFPVREWFIETVANNRGFNFKIFTKQTEALAWLESP